MSTQFTREQLEAQLHHSAEIRDNDQRKISALQLENARLKREKEVLVNQLLALGVKPKQPANKRRKSKCFDEDVDFSLEDDEPDHLKCDKCLNYRTINCKCEIPLFNQPGGQVT